MVGNLGKVNSRCFPSLVFIVFNSESILSIFFRLLTLFKEGLFLIIEYIGIVRLIF